MILLPTEVFSYEEFFDRASRAGIGFSHGSPAAAVASVPGGSVKTVSVEHPSGEVTCLLTLDEDGAVSSAALLRTARKLMDGWVFP